HGFEHGNKQGFLEAQLIPHDEQDQRARRRRDELRRAVAPTEKEALHEACDKDDTLGDLVRMLDAEVVPDAEREDWLRRDDGAKSSGTS
ncbi:hypothetical protein KKA85_09920, partial [bacterium]|nr:hypothetical protein [bacterium]